MNKKQLEIMKLWADHERRMWMIFQYWRHECTLVKWSAFNGDGVVKYLDSLGWIVQMKISEFEENLINGKIVVIGNPFGMNRLNHLLMTHVRHEESLWRIENLHLWKQLWWIESALIDQPLLYLKDVIHWPDDLQNLSIDLLLWVCT